MIPIHSFQNEGGRGIVSALGPDIYARGPEWYRGLAVNGERVMQIGTPCGTCGFLFEKLGEAQAQLTDSEAVDILGPLDELPDSDALASLAKVFPDIELAPIIVEGVPILVEPGDENDYFEHEEVDLWGRDPVGGATNPGTPYYRVGEPGVTTVSYSEGWKKGWKYTSLVASFAVPLHSPSDLNEQRIDAWTSSESPLTAMALGVIDVKAPADSPDEGANLDSSIDQHRTLACYLVDGHHRIAAAARTGRIIRILTFVDPAASVAEGEEWPSSLPLFGRQ